MLLTFLMLPLLILCCVSDMRHKIWKPITVIILFLFFIFVIGLRDANYGLDIVTYYGIFKDPNYYILDEKGLYVLNSVLKLVSDEYVFFSISYSVILNTLLLLLYRNISRELFLLYFAITLSSFIYFQINFNIYRQGLAVILVLLGMHSAYRSNIIFAIIYIVIAFFIHKASIIGFIFVGIILFKIKFRPIYAFFAILSSVLTFNDSLFIYISRVLVEIFPLYANSITEYIRLTGSDIIQPSSFNHRNLPLMISLFFYAVYIHRGKSNYISYWGEGGEFSDKIATISSFILFISSIFSSNVLLYDRIIIFAQLLSPILTVAVLGRVLKNELRVRFFILLICAVQLIFTLIVWGPRNFIPEYEFISL